MKYLLIIVSVIFLAGCSTVRPSITEYRVMAESIKINSDAQACKDKSLKVVQSFSSSALMSLRMDYAESDSRVCSYSQSQWRESPNHSISQQILKSVRDTGLFKNVLSSKSRSKSSWILESNIEDFMQYYSDDLKESYANVVISVSIVDSKSGSVIATETFNSKVSSKTLDAEGGVQALNSALSKVLEKNIEWLDGVCR